MKCLFIKYLLGRKEINFSFNKTCYVQQGGGNQNDKLIKKQRVFRLKEKIKGGKMKLKSFVSFLTLLLMLSPFVLCQSRETGAIVGTVMDEEEVPLPGVTLTLTSPNLIGTRTAITDTEGGFRFPSLPPGVYTLKAELPGFGTTVR